jgi:hypothetical protein
VRRKVQPDIHPHTSHQAPEPDVQVKKPINFPSEVLLAFQQKAQPQAALYQSLLVRGSFGVELVW